MLSRLGLRLRIFLFFALIGLGGVALAGGALYYGWTRAAADAASNGYLTAFLLSPRSSGMNAQGLVVDAGMGVNYFDDALVGRE